MNRESGDPVAAASAPARVLVVDDDAGVREFLETALREDGYRVAAAADVAEALVRLGEAEVDLVVIDVMMPGEDGLVLLRRVKERFPDTAVVMLTAVHDLKIAIECLTQGADQFLLKPIDVDELSISLRKSLEHRKLVVENRSYQETLEQKVQARTEELKAANERLLELDELKNEFVSRVSHELRGPLTAMQTQLSVLSEEMVGPLNPDQKGLLGQCQANIDRLSRMVENVLDLARIQRGEVAIAREVLPPGPLVESVVRYFGPLADERQIDLRGLPEPPDVARIAADPDKLEQVLTNLVDNALKFTPAGGSVTVGLRPHDDVVWFDVHDTGVGVRPEDRRRIFERFTQGQVPEGWKAKGAGLGLSIARSLVELHGGQLRIDSAEGEGTTVSFSMPRIRGC